MDIESTCLQNEASYEVSNAILLYGKQTGYSNSREICFASIHDVETKKGAPAIKPGQAIAKKALFEALKCLAPDDYVDDKELFAENILAKGVDHLVWYAKPQKRQVWFNNKEIGNTSFMANHPGLVFVVAHGKWYVFAVKSEQRPTHETELFVSPYLNVWGDGHICAGNVDLPKGKTKFNTSAWEDVFYRSYFTHPNVHTKGGLTKYRGGIFALWRALMKGRAFPVNSLVHAHETLSSMFERVVKHGRA